MPNCDFYALRDDHAEILNFILSETDCQLFEMYSQIGASIHEFKDVETLLHAYDKGKGGLKLLLNLYSPKMKGTLKTRRIDLDEKRFGKGAFRYEIHGWGAIQLYLGGEYKGKLHNSHTNHNSEKRALTWSSTIHDLGSPASWNWQEVSSISNRINRFIRKVSVDRHGSRSILPDAMAWVKAGGILS